MSAWLLPAAAQQQPGAADLQGLAQSLLAQMSGEVVRLRTYLIFYDQINRLQVATGRMKVNEADTKLQQKSQELLQTSYLDPELDRLINEHRREADGYFAKIEQSISTTRRWPKGAHANEYKTRAKSELQSVRRDYEARISQRLDPLQALEQATKVLGWTMGHATPPPNLNVFAGQQARIGAAVQNPLFQSLLNAAAMARSGMLSQQPPSVSEPTIVTPGDGGGVTVLRPQSGPALPQRPGASGIPERAPSVSGSDPQITVSPKDSLEAFFEGVRAVPPEPPPQAQRSETLRTPSVPPPSISPPSIETQRSAKPATPIVPPSSQQKPETESRAGQPTQPPVVPIAPQVAKASPPPAAGITRFPPPAKEEDEHAYWRKVYAADTREGYASYLEHFPTGEYKSLARLGLSASNEK